MKLIAALLATLTCFAGTHTAYAIAFAEVTVSETAIHTNVPPGTLIRFSGEQAIHLMKMLPKTSTAGNHPADKRIRGVLIRNEKFDLIFECDDIVWQADGQLGTRTPECTITLNRMNPDIYGIPFDELTPE
jgi:hypothetical protein